MHSDSDLRSLACWLPGWKELIPVQAEIEETWKRLKDLRARAAEIRVRMISSSPLDLTDLEARFWPKVAIIDDDDSCWEWRRSRRPGEDNYGQFRWTNPFTGQREVAAASRIALFLVTGELPDHSCHTCDNPPCCRPKHLYDGTHLDNMRDRHDRGRYGGWTRRDQTGTKNSQAKLTDQMVILARDLARTGATLEVVHAELGHPCNQTVLRFAITGRTWKHLNETSPPVLKR